MHINQKSLTFLASSLTLASGALLAPVYPPPKDITSDSSHVAAAWKNVTSTIKSLLEGNQTEELGISIGDVTFSAGLFSINDPEASSLQFHYTGPETRDAANGTTEVDGDTIYPVASITKVFTVLLGLLELTPEQWETPLAEIFPALADYVADNTDAVWDTRWDQITPYQLSGQISGVPNYVPALGDELALFETAPSMALPEIYDLEDPTTLPECLQLLPPAQCQAPMYTADQADLPPIFAPWASPSYSNNGFILLGAALANLTGADVPSLMQERVFEPLGMRSSSIGFSNDTDLERMVVIGEAGVLPAGLTSPSGGLLTSINDLARFGQGVLNSTLLSPLETRRWMKPISHSGHLQYSVGRPWEIQRYFHAESGLFTDMYTKYGDSGTAGSVLVLLPDFDAGFTVLGGATSLNRSVATGLIADTIANSILPALMRQGAKEAKDNFAGTYEAPESNSSLTLSVVGPDNAAPGLKIESFSVNGTDVTETAAKWRLVPTLIDAKNCSKISFRASRIDDPASKEFKPSQATFSEILNFADWLTISGQGWGGRGLSQFVADVEDGKATSMTSAAWKVTMARQGQKGPEKRLASYIESGISGPEA